MAEKDFKYSMEDLYRVYIGVKSSYRELLESEQVNTRVKAVIRQYLLPLVDGDTTLESHLYYMNSEDEAFSVYRHLGAKVLLSRLSRKRFAGGDRTVRREALLKIENLASFTPEEKEQNGFILTELQIPKLKLAGFVW